MKKRIICIIQARTGSNRLPNKIFLDLEGVSVLGRDIELLRKSKLIDKIVVACPDKKKDDVIEDYITENYSEVGVYRGSENDVLDRYYQAAKKFKASIVIRITSDCPLVDSTVVDKVIQTFLEKEVDYVANILGKRTYPRGLDTEVFSFKVLEKMWKDAKEDDNREHVTLYLRKHPELFSTCNVEGNCDYSQYRLTLDTEDDYKLIKKIYQELNPDNLDLESVVNFLKQNPKLVLINKDVKQKYGQY